MIGLRIGNRIGLDIGGPPAPGGFSPVPDVSLDATARRHVPADAGEWDALLAAAGISSGGPSHLYLCQGVAGAAVDQIGAVNLASSGVVTYENAVTGWDRDSMNTTDGSISQGWFDGTIVNLATASALMLAYVRLTGTPGGEREVMGLGSGTDHRYVAVTAGAKYKATGLAGASVTGTASPGSDVHPLILKVDRSRSHYRVYTDQETLAPAWTNPGAGGSLIAVGDAAGVTAGPVGFLYIALFTGAAAQMSDAEVATLLATLGW